MIDFKFYTEKITRYIYLQPEITVSIEKIAKKFHSLTRDELYSILEEMEKNNFIESYPKSAIKFQTVGSIDDDGNYTKIEDEKIESLVSATHVSLTLKGKENAEEQHTLILKARKELITKPIINSLISGLIGMILGYIIRLLQ